MKTIVVDVSHHQKQIDWGKVKESGITHAIIRAGYGKGNKDKWFDYNIEQAIDNGFTIGFYWFLYAVTITDGIINADEFHSLIKPYKDRISLKVWADWEYDSDDYSIRNGVWQKKESRTLIVKAFLKRMQEYGYEVGVYANPDYINGKFGDLSEYPLWLAWYDGTEEKVKSRYSPVMWQYSSKGSVDGIIGNVDMNYYYGESDEVKEETDKDYSLPDFILDSRRILGVSDTASAQEILDKTVTVGTETNKNHAIVTPLERYMKSLGYYTGSIEADFGKQPVFGSGMKKAIELYQKEVVKASAKNQDGILSEKGATWKTLYGVKKEAKPKDKVVEYSLKEDGETSLSENFKVKEFRCKDGSDRILISDELVKVLQKIRNHFGKAVTINSAYRTPSYNKKIGGATSSQHMYGTAADIRINGITPKAVADYAETLLLGTGGIGRYSTFTHVDVRNKKARWNG